MYCVIYNYHVHVDLFLIVIYSFWRKPGSSLGSVIVCVYLCVCMCVCMCVRLYVCVCAGGGKGGNPRPRCEAYTLNPSLNLQN